MPNGFVYIERPWGSLFYKHLGERNKFQAQKECTNTNSTHLPIPRSVEENEFYRNHFGTKSLWLDISKAYNSYNYEDSNQTVFSSIIKTNDDVVQIDKYDWVTFNLTKSAKETRSSREVILLQNGQYDAVSGSALNEAVCVYNVISEQNCTRCSNVGFCQNTNNANNETKCVCPSTRRGENCEIDLCSRCQNDGTCRIKEGTNETECICPRPFGGQNCEYNFENLIDFTLIEKPWGSMLYKHIGKLSRDSAKMACSKRGENVHLPTPRFPEENDFYRTHFGNVSLWIDITDMVTVVRNISDNVIIKNFDWINLNVTDESFSIDFMLTGTGQWEGAKKDILIDSICVKNIQPERGCSRCSNDALCRFTDFTRNATDCNCPSHREGLNCEIDLCSVCQNNGFCKISETNQVECICSRPFDGKHCEVNLCPHCENGGYCIVSDKQIWSNLTNFDVSDCICPLDYYGKFCEKGELKIFGKT